MRIASMFSGAGGFEIGLGTDAEFVFVNDINPTSQRVLTARFPGIPLIEDVRDIGPDDLAGADTIVAGFPCQDVSIVGGQRGLGGSRSALVEHVFRLAAAARTRRILLENVQSIRFVHEGRVLAYLMHSAEQLGYAWAYRILDSRAFGLAQRRRRFYFLASLDEDPGDALLCSPGQPLPKRVIDPARPIGFYWTEGRLGNGITDDAIPPLKIGSALDIPSPPAVLFPDGSVKTPTIETAEQLQGFPAGWTDVVEPRQRWRLVGNAVSPPVIDWIRRQFERGEPWNRALASEMPTRHIWPTAAWGDGSGRRLAVAVHEAPDRSKIGRLSDYDFEWADLSQRALKGFAKRARASNLRYPPAFLDRLEARLV
jgi:DNA (cytosine-5)-methyltransferase 1